MKYINIGEPNAVMWVAEDSSSGVSRPGDSEWVAYLEWCATGGVPAPLRQPAPLPSLDNARADATARLSRAVDEALQPILSQYAAAEVASWAEQLTEASAWLADSTARTPLIDAICGGGDKTTLCNTIVDKSIAYKQLSGPVFAWRGKCSTWIDNAADVATLMSWQARYPEVPNAAY
jgi:hypothetical protein